MDIDLRPVTVDDRPFLLRLYAETRSGEMDLVPWSELDKQAFVETQFEAQTADYTTRFNGSEHSIISRRGTAIGRIWVHRQPGEIRLLDVTIRAEDRNQGVGTGFLLDLQREATERQLPVRHSVYKTNDGALRLYTRLGFRVVEDYEAYVLMEWTPSNEGA